MTLYRRKPSYVSAVQLTQDAVISHVLDRTPLPDGSILTASGAHLPSRMVYHAVVRLQTKERELVMPGDWIVRAEDGTLSVVKPEVFAEMYEAAADEPEASIREAFVSGFAIGVERGHDTAIVPAKVTEDTVREDRAVCDRALKEHMVGLAEQREPTAGWRTEPPTLDEVKAGAGWWWYRQRGEDGYTAPHVLEIGWDDDGLFFVEPGCPRVTPEEYGDGAEWHLCLTPPTTRGTP